MRIIFLLSSLLIFCSCAKTPVEEVDDAIDIAQTMLSSNECQSAIDILEDVGRQNDNPIYLQVLASAYACKASFKELTFIGNVSSLNTTSAGFMKSLSAIASSVETQANSVAYTNLLTGINILQNADGGAQPSQATRNTVFGSRKAGDMGFQILFMSFAQLGKFLHYYGNVDISGNKGAGALASTCFVTYIQNDAKNYLKQGSAPGGVCNDPGATDFGHPDLSFAGGSITATRAKMCEGLMLITNIIDTLNNVTLSSNSTLANLTTIKTLVTSFKSSVLTVDPSAEMVTLLDTTLQSSCETQVATAGGFDKLQILYATLFETGLK